ncbi:MAG: 2-(1,2-epoxy,2-dihydrophenyl)acetyl-CoA isomerase, partial [Solirubrobacteraceae bacterium]|nr:2-(1,2-epoxy,2-dihydrophenyl)acetyl-CoA isomerase [Solirubrobacteraceae bacterium]
LRELRRPILAAWNLLEEMPKPTIAQIHGACLGGAMELALACDLRTMAADAIIGAPETRIGLVPDLGGASRLPSVVGLGRAKELIMASKLIDGTEAERIGLANRVGPEADLDAVTGTLVDEAARVRAGRGRPREAGARRGGQAGACRDARAGGRRPGGLRANGRLRGGDARLRREAHAGVRGTLTPGARLSARPRR